MFLWLCWYLLDQVLLKQGKQGNVGKAQVVSNYCINCLTSLKLYVCHL